MEKDWESQSPSRFGNKCIKCKNQTKQKAVVHRIRRNWCLPVGHVFDMRAPDEWIEKWDFSRRADRRMAWRGLAKEEAMLVVLGKASSRRGQGDHRRFRDRVCTDQANKGRYFVCEVDAEMKLPG